MSVDDEIRAVVEVADRRRAALEKETGSHRVGQLPLRFLRQVAHFTTPATDEAMARKAAESGYAAAGRLLERVGVSPTQLGEVLGVPEERITRVLARQPAVAPLVMIDGEDASAPREDLVRQGRASAARVFRDASWHPASLRFYRPNGLSTGWTADDLAHVLLAAGPGRVEGIVFPKAEHAAEVQWLDETLASIERRLGVPERSTKVALLVESGWGVRNLEQLALAALPRLCSLVLGIADYSSDVGLPEIRNDHPTADWVRMEMVNVAGAVGVPAIDTMTFGYPVPDSSLQPSENRLRVLNRLKVVYEDALHGVSLGMAGKWAGHPLQLFVVLLAYEATLDTEKVERKVREVEAYQEAISRGLGATMLEGMMVDRATDRHARELLRRAAALGYLELKRAHDLSLISDEEAASQVEAAG